MILRLVEKANRNCVVEDLDDQSEIVRAYFSRTMPLDEGLSEIALDVLEKSINEDLYFMCDCYPVGQEQAFLYPVRSGSLRRLPHPPNRIHHNNCKFGNHGTAREIAIETRRTEKGLAVFGPYVNRKDNVAEVHARRRESVARLPRLSHTLFRVIEEAELNKRVRAEPPKSHSVRAWDASGRLELTEGFSLQKAFGSGDFEHGPAGVGRISYLKQEIGNAASWPKNLRPQAYFCGQIESFRYLEEKGQFAIKFYGWDDLQYVKCRPHVFGGYVRDSKRAPYIGIIGYALPTPRSKKALGLRCFMQPCADYRDWFPVDSDLERQTFLILSDLQRTMPELNISIVKPVFDVKVCNKARPEQFLFCKPDFIVEYEVKGVPKKVAIETMGLRDTAYEERKSRTHLTMLYEYRGLIQHNFTTENRDKNRLFVDQLLALIHDGIQPKYATLLQRRRE